MKCHCWRVYLALTFWHVFLMKYTIKGQLTTQCYILHLPWLAHWLRHRCYLAVSPKPSFFLCCLLWHRGCLYDITGALFAAVPSPFFVDGFAPLCGFVAIVVFIGLPHVFVQLSDWHLTQLVLLTIMSLHHCSADWRALRPGPTQAAASKKSICPSQ